MQLLQSLGLLLVCSFALSLVLTPFCRNLFLHLKVVDQPDERKTHKGDIPRVGGIAIITAYFLSITILVLVSGRGSFIALGPKPILWRVLLPGALMFVVGLIDDLVTLTPSQKLLGQILAAGLACALGVRILAVGGTHTLAGWLSVPLTIAWLVACTNAFNLIDGIDGLAAGVGLFATCTTMMAALFAGNTALALLTVPLAGALLAFLRYNFNPASIFLGDCGSLTVGFLLGCYSAIWSEKSATLLGIVAPMMALVVPLADTSLSIARRFLRNKPIFQPDRGHIHHMLLARGLSPRNVTLTLYGVCGVAAVLSLLESLFYNRIGGLVVVFFCFVVWIGIRRLNYIEFNVLRDMFTPWSVRQVRDEINMRHFTDELQKTESPAAFLELVSSMADRCRIYRVSLEIAGRVFETGSGGESDEVQTAHFDIALSPATILRFEHSQMLMDFQIVYRFVEAVRTGLEAHHWASPYLPTLDRRVKPRRLKAVPPAAMTASARFSHR